MVVMFVLIHYNRYKNWIHTTLTNYLILALYKEYNSEIIKNFYLTLKNLLDDNPDCRDYCELVYYDGMYMNFCKVVWKSILTIITKYFDQKNY